MKKRLINIVSDLQKITENICTCKTINELFDLFLKYQIKPRLFGAKKLNNDYIGCDVKSKDFIITFDMLTDDDNNINELTFYYGIKIYIPATHNYIKLPLFDLLDIERAKQYNYMF